MRRKIWEENEIQCSILGTCLSIKELHKIARQSKLDISEKSNDFELHAAFVRLCASPGKVAKAVNKFLDRKFAGAVRTFTRETKEEKLTALWKKSLENGDIPGPYWAMMTHPTASPTLLSTVFGDVHMLSHLVGACNRADIRRLTLLESNLRIHQEQQAKTKRIYRGRFKKLVADNSSLTRKLSAMSKEAETLRFQAKKHGSELLYKENQALQQSLSLQSMQLVEKQARMEQLEQKVNAYESKIKYLDHELEEKRAEVSFLENEVQNILPTTSDPACSDVCTGTCPGTYPGTCPEECAIALHNRCEKAGTPECPGPELCGKRILYVGGRINLVPHYKHVVERHGGEFLHHDGGIEHARTALPKMIHGVDAVVCPVDCVSHDACLRVKETCKYTMKPCKMLRSSGLTSLVRSLEELVAQPSI